MTKIGTVIDGKYEILTEIGRGGMSTVYLAMDKHLNKQWAVKEIRKKGDGKNDKIVVNSLLAEANLMKRLDHPSLPRIVDIIDNGITIYVVMDYIEGRSLDGILKEYGAQPEEMVIGWAKQLCDALSYLHTQKPPIIYRDMKPANIMLKPEGNIKIIDFGIAREYKEKNLADTTVLGTPGYAPPEQYTGQTDPRSDIYALGMTMHHLLTGVDPRTQSVVAPVRQWNPDLSEGIEAIIDKCVQTAQDNRYQNCEELLYDLEHPEYITKGYKRSQKNKMSAFIVSACLSIVLCIVGFATNFAATKINNDNYDYYINIMESTSLQNKIVSYKSAIDIYPYDTVAYQKILEAYEMEGIFDKEANDTYLALYNANKDGFDVNSQDVAQLNYKTGMMYFNYYSNNGNESFSTRIQKAFPFFTANYNNQNVTFDEKDINDCYYQICDFYKKYVFESLSVEEASKDNYDALFTTINSTLDKIDSAKPNDKLALYNGTFMFLYDQRANMRSVNVEMQDILDILDDVYSRAKGITVQKEQSKKLRQEIIDKYSTYKAAIERTYRNAEKGEV